MNEQELNRRLAEWAGFYQSGKQWLKEEGVHSLTDIVYAEYNLPDFTQSLDSCFKWLVPKARKYNEIQLIFPPGDTRCLVKIGWSDYSVADVPSLSICLAIEKLIDSGK